MVMLTTSAMLDAGQNNVKIYFLLGPLDGRFWGVKFKHNVG